MSETRAVMHKSHGQRARVLIVAGVAILSASAALGVLSRQRMPDLRPVDFGQQVQITATDSTSATIFASTGLSRTPSCKVTSANGAAVSVGEAERYLQGGGLESAFGFPVTSGTTYAVTCTSAADPGRFAVAQDDAMPKGVFIASGSLGLVMCGLGVIASSRRRAMNPSAQSTR